MRLQKMAEESEIGSREDLTRFAGENKRRVLQLLALQKEVEDLTTQLRTREGQGSTIQAVIDVRKNEIAEIKKKINSAKQATQVALAKQSDLEKQLFQFQTVVRDLQKRNRDLEQEIRAQEKGR
jgi:chromosome segregation ATPase